MRKLLALGAVLMLALAAQSWAVEAKINSRPLTAQEIADYALAAETQKSAGLFTVGIGTPAYLEVLVPEGTVVTGDATWALTGPGSAALVDDPLAGAPTHIPGDRELYVLVGRKGLYPDAAGQWVVTVSVPIETVGDDGVTPVADTIELTETVTAAEYVGAGGIEGAAPTMGQCMMCHPEKAAAWSETGHAEIFTLGIEGIASDHYGANCIVCHTVGYDAAPAAVNGGFDDVALETGWVFPEHAGEGEWALVPPALQAVSNVQCESCHGPGSQHNGRTGAGRISVSYDSGNCGFCHDRGTHHCKNREWANSVHASNVDEGGRASCSVCHSGVAFAETMAGAAEVNLEHGAIGCATCHDPHSAENPHQVRMASEIVLGDGTVITGAGTGMLCMNCHKGRREAVTYVEGTGSSHFGPHHGPQADMIYGTNAITYGRTIPSSRAHSQIEEGCAACHMQEVSPTLEDGSVNPTFAVAGGHTFKPGWEGEDLTEACAECHGAMDSFDIPREDFDGDGRIEGVQTEIHGLLDILGKALPPIGSTEVAITSEYTPKELKAAYDYRLVEEDGSFGIHNTRFAVGLLKVAIADMTGRQIGGGGAVRVLQGGRPRGGLVASASPAGKFVTGIYGLYQNGPNPFNPETEIRYEVPEPADVRLTIYNSLGQTVRTLVEAHHATGSYAVTWDGRDESGAKVTAGVYVYTMEAGSFVGSGKMVLLP